MNMLSDFTQTFNHDLEETSSTSECQHNVFSSFRDFTVWQL